MKYLLFVCICVPFFIVSVWLLKNKNIGFPLSIPIWILIGIFTILDFVLITPICKLVEH